jgi:serine/threonine protein kinase
MQMKRKRKRKRKRMMTRQRRPVRDERERGAAASCDNDGGGDDEQDDGTSSSDTLDETLDDERPSRRAYGQGRRVHYTAPELLASPTARADPRTDLFSLGVTLYELLNGVLPADVTNDDDDDDAAAADDDANINGSNNSNSTSNERSERNSSRDERYSDHGESGFMPGLLLTTRRTSALSVAAAAAGTPRGLLAIVDKLRARDPQHRYQSCYGALHDLRTLARLLADARSAGASRDSLLRTTFPLGSHDVPLELRFPAQFYGPDRAVVSNVSQRALAHCRSI